MDSFPSSYQFWNQNDVRMGPVYAANLEVSKQRLGCPLNPSLPPFSMKPYGTKILLLVGVAPRPARDTC